MAGWNFAELWERIAAEQPDADAQVQGDRRISWGEFDRRADGLARFLLDRGATHQDKVAIYVHNCPEYLETSFACYKAGLVPVNTNYRYVEDELAYLWDNADAMAVVFHGTFADRVDAVRTRVPTVTTWLWVDDGSGPCPAWATPYEDAAATPTATSGSGSGGHTVAEWGRSGDDILMIYTGGTTGMPKGTMWRQDDLIRALCSTGNPVLGEECETAGYDAALENIGANAAPGLLACPLMHGTGWFTANITVEELLDVTEAEKVGALTIVGDAFAKPMVSALDAEPDRWDISSVVLITSSGVMWSESAKKGLLAHHPGMLLVDSFSSSEAIGLGQSVSAGDSATSRSRRRARLGGDRAGGRRRPRAARLLQGRGQVGQHVHHDRRQALQLSRRLGQRGGRRHDHAVGPGLGVHQHRRREGVSRGGGGGAEDPWQRVRRRRRRRAR